MRKRILLLMLSVVMVFGFGGCDTRSQAEKEMEKAQEILRIANDAYQKSLEEYDQLQRDLDRYNELADQVKNAK